MIRINLLPIKQARKRETGRNQILILLIVMAVEVGLCVLALNEVKGQISAQEKENEVVQTQIDQIKKEIQDHDKIQAQLKEIEEREKIIADLQAARTGPVYIMYELMQILSLGGGPTTDREAYQEMVRLDPSRGYDETWDYRRVWITSMSEKSRKVSFSGYGVSHEDVAEFLRRLNISDFFTDNVLKSTSLKSAGSGHLVQFSISSNVKYK